MIFCFSGTGNSRYAADRIALLTGDTVTDMNGLIRQGDMNGSIGDSHIVIVAPTYAWRLPRVVEKWLRTEVIVGRSKPELAEAKGKRMLIASELEEGTRLSTSIVKQLCSTDDMTAEKKYKDPFTFEPTHTTVLYTNHLPKIGAKDAGIWRRLIVIPFDAKIEGKSDIKNYTDYLFRHAGGAILSWIIEGAEEVIRRDFRIPLPDCVRQATSRYREENDWLGHFLSERCEIGDDLQAKSGELYTAYRNYCAETGEYTRSTTNFYNALENDAFVRVKTRTGYVIKGLSLGRLADAEGDFLV